MFDLGMQNPEETNQSCFTITFVLYFTDHVLSFYLLCMCLTNNNNNFDSGIGNMGINIFAFLNRSDKFLFSKCRHGYKLS